MQLIIFLILAVNYIFPNNSYAIKNYSIENLKIESSNDNIDQAKIDALREGQVKAFSILFYNITKKNINLESVKSDIISLIYETKITEEKINGKNYNAIINVYFKYNETEAFINKINSEMPADIAPSSQYSLVIPLIIQNKNIYFSDLSQDWVNQWKEIHLANNNLKFNIPILDLQEISLLRKIKDLNFTDDHLGYFKNRYNIEKILVFALEKQSDNGHYILFVGDFSNNNDQVKLVEISRLDSNKSKDVILKEAAQIFIDSFFNFKPQINKQENPDPDNMLYSDDVGIAEIQVKFKSIQEWKDIQNKLKVNPNTKSFDIITMQSQYCNIKLQYIGELEDFINSLVDQEMKVEKDGNNLNIENW